MEKEKVMEWVQKLMTKAMHPNTPEHEVEACKNKAAEFMARYKISMTQAMQDNKSSDPNHGMEREEVDFIVGGRTDWGYWLAMRISEAFDCKMVSLQYKQKVCFLGYADDVDTCKWFFDYLQMEIYIWAEQHSKGKKKQNSYAHGMVVTVGKRLKELYERVEEIIPSECRALIVVKKQKVDNFLKKEFPILVPSKSPKKNTSSFSQGMKDGNKLDLSNQNRKKVAEQRKLA